MNCDTVPSWPAQTIHAGCHTTGNVQYTRAYLYLCPRNHRPRRVVEAPRALIIAPGHGWLDGRRTCVSIDGASREQQPAQPPESCCRSRCPPSTFLCFCAPASRSRCNHAVCRQSRIVMRSRRRRGERDESRGVNCRGALQNPGCGGAARATPTCRALARMLAEAFARLLARSPSCVAGQRRTEGLRAATAMGGARPRWTNGETARGSGV